MCGEERGVCVCVCVVSDVCSGVRVMVVSIMVVSVMVANVGLVSMVVSVVVVR